MRKNLKKKRVFRSISEFEKEFLPKSVEKRKAEKPTDAKALGIVLAKETLEKVRVELK